jgi:hypothetical protein
VKHAIDESGRGDACSIFPHFPITGTAQQDAMGRGVDGQDGRAVHIALQRERAALERERSALRSLLHDKVSVLLKEIQRSVEELPREVRGD